MPQSASPGRTTPSSEQAPFLVYRDVLLPSSETFIPRMYLGFRRLRPIYLGARRGSAFADLGAEAHLLRDHARTGWLGQQLFRHLGWLPPDLRRWIARTRPALVHAQFGRGGALALPLAQACGLPLVVTFHGGDASKDKHFTDDGPFRTIFQRRRAALARHADIFLCVSDWVRNMLIGRGFPPEKLRTHHLGIDIPAAATAAWPDPGSKRLLVVGRLVAKKGFEDLIPLMLDLERQGRTDLELVVVGDGPERQRLEAAVGRAGIRARFTGWRSPTDVAAEMAAALALLVPSRRAASGDAEGLPTVILEAQARGLPVIATRHGGIPEAVADGETGLLVSEARPDQLAQAVGRLLDDEALHVRLQTAGRRSVAAGFDASRQSARLEDILLEVAARRPRGPCQ
jgi:colanic acid/amylovoran biosynthesis glycosyltransferase